MPYFKIRGGKKLSGVVEARGSKNATTPILAATLLTDKPCVISNVPRIEDVFVMLEILKSMGAKVEWKDLHTVRVRAKDIDPKKINVSEVKKLRSSILLFGPLSARFDQFSLYHPGGCVIGARPVGTHFDALEKMGIQIKTGEKSYRADASKRVANKVILQEFSPTATENIMMLAASMPGKTVIKIAATEPHVEDLGRFLQTMGAKIEGLGTHTITVHGKAQLRGAKHTVIPDANEAATFLIMGAMLKSAITVQHAREEHLDIVLEKLRQFGVGFKVRGDAITIVPARTLRAVTKIDARIYPGFPSDIQAPMGVLATQASGETLIHDTLYEGRFNYVRELRRMGAKAKILNNHQVLIKGPTKLSGTTITSFDLRCGASLIVAALSARGTTIIKNIYQVDRGYELIEERLQKLGADIKRIEK